MRTLLLTPVFVLCLMISSSQHSEGGQHDYHEKQIEGGDLQKEADKVAHDVRIYNARNEAAWQADRINSVRQQSRAHH